MDLRKIRKLIEIFNSSKLSELEIREENESIRLTRNVTLISSDSTPQEVEQVSTTPSPEVTEVFVEDELAEFTYQVTSPMVGTFFSAPSPTENPFVKVGDRVQVGQPLCLIEAMKLFNQIDAERSGTVVKVMKQDGDPVEYGEPLFVMSE